MTRKIGRPSDYKPEYCDRIIECGLKGMHVYQMCKEFMCSQQTLYAWASQNEEFLEAFTCARQFAKGVMLDRVDANIENKDAQPKLLEAKATFLTDYVQINGFQEENDPIKQIEMLIKAVDRGERSAKVAEMMCSAIEKRINATERLELEPLLKKLEASIEAQNK